MSNSVFAKDTVRHDAPTSRTTAGRELKAVLWDMDGTLIDTEPYWIRAEQRLVADHGGTWNHDQAQHLVGQPLLSSATILQEAGVRRSTEEIIDWLSNQVVSEIRRSMPWRPGARELLADLRRHRVRCALVTMSYGPMAEEIAANLPAGSLEFMITGDAVQAGKPDPEPYLRALSRLAEADPGIAAGNCVAIEDSIPGTTAALAAGLATIAVPHMVELAARPGQTRWDTLSSKTAADVAALVEGDR